MDEWTEALATISLRAEATTNATDDDLDMKTECLSGLDALAELLWSAHEALGEVSSDAIPNEFIIKTRSALLDAYTLIDAAVSIIDPEPAAVPE
jgi:hypothetical protein